MDTQETPITKYLANLEKRQAMLFNTSQSPTPTTSTNIQRRIDFEEDSFLGGQDTSMLHISPTEMTRFSTVRRKRPRPAYLEEPDELEKKNSALEQMIREAQAQLVDSRTKVTKLEHLLEAATKNHAVEIVKTEHIASDIRSKYRDAMNKVSQLEKELQQRNSKDSDRIDKHQQDMQVNVNRCSQLQERILKLEKENFDMRLKIGDGKTKSDDTIRKLANDLSETEHGAEKWIMECQLLKDQLAIKESQLETCRDELKRIQSRLIKLEASQTFSDEPSLIGESVEQVAALKKDCEERITKFENMYVKQQNENNNLVRQMKKVQDENDVLKTTMRSEMLLNEKIDALEKELAEAKESLKDKTAIEVDRDATKDELNIWKQIAIRIDQTCTSALSFESFLRQNQNLLLELKHENSTLKLGLSSANSAIKKVENEAAIARDRVKVIEEEKNKMAVDIKKLTRRLLLITKDRDGLKCLKESYEQEFTGLLTSPFQERVAQLEKMVVDYEALIKEEAETKKPCENCITLEKTVNELKTELDNQRQFIDSGNTTLLGASQQAGGSSTMDDSGLNQTTDSSFKVVSYGMNPSQITVDQRVKELIAENDKLKDRIKELEDQTILDSSSTPAALSEHAKLLDEQLKTLERKHKILTDDYNFETEQLQNAIFKIFGYHLTLHREPQTQIRLVSIYSTSTEDFFIFQEADNGDMMLLDTPLVSHFRDDVDRFLISEGSIPAFISSVTVMYTQNRTLPQHSTMATQERTLTTDDVTDDEPLSSGSHMVQIELESGGSQEDRDSASEQDVEEIGDEEEENEENVEEEYGESEGDEEEEPEDDHQDDDSDDSDIVALD